MRLMLLPLRFPSEGWVVCAQDSSGSHLLRWAAVSGRRWLHAVTDTRAVGALELLSETSVRDARRAAHAHVQRLLGTGWDLAAAPLPVSVSAFERCGSSRHLPVLVADSVGLVADRLSVSDVGDVCQVCVVQLPGRQLQFVPGWLLAASTADSWPFSSFVAVSLSRRMIAAAEAVCPAVVPLGSASDPTAVQHAELVAALAMELTGISGARERVRQALQTAEALACSPSSPTM